MENYREGCLRRGQVEDVSEESLCILCAGSLKGSGFCYCMMR